MNDPGDLEDLNDLEDLDLDYVHDLYALDALDRDLYRSMARSSFLLRIW